MGGRTETPDKYDELLRLADDYDRAGEQMREWAELGADVLGDPAVHESADLCPRTWAPAEDAVRAATLGKHGLLSRSLELDADALVLRATVLTYRWIDELQAAAYDTLGSIAGRAIGYLAPQVELGGAVVAAGLIETDALDRDGMTAYLGELALAHPELMEHVTTGGGLAESLQLRGLLTSAAIADDPAARRGGLRALGLPDLEVDLGAVVRDAAAAVSDEPPAPREVEVVEREPYAGLAALFTDLHDVAARIGVRRVRPDRAVVLLPAPDPDDTGAPQLVGAVGAAADVSSLAGAIAEAVGPETRVVLVGAGAGGAAALALADDLAVDQVLTTGAPASHLDALPGDVPVAAFDHGANPVALLGALVNARDERRLTVLYDGAAAGDLLAAAVLVDGSTEPVLRALVERLRGSGYLA
jgi:hypothetical protein